LSEGQRLQLINSALSSMPIHFLLSLHIPPGTIEQLNRITRQCLWRDNYDTPKQSLAAREMICKPKMKGGLGIVNFQIKNEALLIKHLHKFYNREDAPWVKLVWEAYYEDQVPRASNLVGSFWWRDIAKLMEKYRQLTKPFVKSGDTVLFWSDEWELGGATVPLRSRFSRLFSFAIDDKIYVKEVCQTQDRSSLFYLSLSSQAYEEYLEVCSWLQVLQLHPSEYDEWKTNWKDVCILPPCIINWFMHR